MPRTQLIQLWVFRVLWIGLVFAIPSSVETALMSHSAPVTWLVAIALWLGWGLGLVGLLVPNPLSLTALRLLALGSFACAVAVAINESANWLALAWSLGVFLVSMQSAVGAYYLDSGSYGDERRFGLRVPGQLLMGPILLVTVALLAGISVGPLLLAAQNWWLGVPATAVGLFLVYKGFNVLYRLTQRWLIFVPTGVVLLDPMQLREPLRMHNKDLESLALANTESDATDLTLGTLGRAIEIRLSLTHPTTTRSGEATEVTSVLIAPTRLLDALEAAKTRGLTAT